MPRRVPTPEAKVQEVAALAAQHQLETGDSCTRRISSETGIARSTVKDILKRVDPLVQELKVFKRDEMITAHQQAFFDAHDDMMTRAEGKVLKPSERRDLSVVMGIHAQRTMELVGHPVVSLQYNLHEHRHDMSAVMDKLFNASKVLEQRRAIGPREAPETTLDGEVIETGVDSTP